MIRSYIVAHIIHDDSGKVQVITTSTIAGDEPKEYVDLISERKDLVQKVLSNVITQDVAVTKSESPTHNCLMCGNPMPEGEEMFNYHGYSCPCPGKKVGKSHD